MFGISDVLASFLFSPTTGSIVWAVGPAISLPSTTIHTLGNWKVDDHKWTVPVNLLFSKLSSFGTFPASYMTGFGGFVASPESGPDWKVRAALTILLPRKK